MWCRFFKPEFVYQIDLHGLRHTQVMIATFREKNLINFCQGDESLVDVIYSQNRVPVVMPIDDDLRTIQPQGLQKGQNEEKGHTGRILYQDVVVVL
jgi:hypothetical protein